MMRAILYFVLLGSTLATIVVAVGTLGDGIAVELVVGIGVILGLMCKLAENNL